MRIYTAERDPETGFGRTTTGPPGRAGFNDLRNASNARRLRPLATAPSQYRKGAAGNRAKYA